jgi:filamentous hemagglutinin
VLALTGRRHLTGYASTEEQYRGLMDAGVAFAKAYRLSPGVALSAEQMAALSTDIVWLTAQSVTLPDGSTTQVLVPQVYLRRPQGQDLQASGALMAGSAVHLQSAGDIANSGTIQGERVVLLGGRDIANQGTLRGNDVLAQAERDLQNLGGTIKGLGADSRVTLLAGRDLILQTTTQSSVNAEGNSTRTNIDRIATVQGGNIRLDAARDLIAQGAQVESAGDLWIDSQRDLKVSAVQGRYTLELDTGGRVKGRTGYIKEDITTQQVSTFSAGRDLALRAASDLKLSGADVTAGAAAYLEGANVQIDAARERRAIDVQHVGDDEYSRAATVDESLVGARITAERDLTIRATEGNLSATGAQLTSSTGQASLLGKGDITLANARSTHSAEYENYQKRAACSAARPRSVRAALRPKGSKASR